MVNHGQPWLKGHSYKLNVFVVSIMWMSTRIASAMVVTRDILFTFYIFDFLSNYFFIVIVFYFAFYLFIYLVFFFYLLIHIIFSYLLFILYYYLFIFYIIIYLFFIVYY